MYIPASIIAQVLTKAKIEDVVKQFSTLKKSGEFHLTKCPFHTEHSNRNTLRVSNFIGTYYCTVCQRKGNPVKYLMESQQFTYTQAITWLADFYKIPIQLSPMQQTIFTNNYTNR